MDLWEFSHNYVLPILLSGGTTFGILKFLSKRFIDQQLKKDIENHKQELTEKTENLKHTLSIYAHERNIKATRVDSDLSNAIKSVYSEFIKLFNAAEIFANQDPLTVCPYEEMEHRDSQKACTYRFYKKYAEEIEEYAGLLQSQLDINAIYIGSETHKVISEIHRNFSRLSKEFLEPIREEEETRGDIEEIVDDLFNLKKDLTDYYNNELSSSKEKIIATFRSQLGIQ